MESDQKPTNLAKKVSAVEQSRRCEALLLRCMGALALGLGVEITKERVILYLKPLSDLSESQIKRGFALALKEYKPYGGSFPAPSEIREFALRDEVPRQAEVDEIVPWKLGEKPENWIPLDELKEKLRPVASFPTGHDLTSGEVDDRIAMLREQARRLQEDEQAS